MTDRPNLRDLARDHLKKGELKQRQDEGTLPEDEGSAIPPMEMQQGPKESIAGENRLINPGSGGATEHAGRLPHHEGMPSPKNQPNS
jgi:hypothetical protein